MKKNRMTLLAFTLIAALCSCSKSDTAEPVPENQDNTIVLTLPGTLSKSLSKVDKSTFTSLTLEGAIDARDFKTMRDSMPVLANIDLSKATIKAFTGTNGTRDELAVYYANTIPVGAFYSTLANPMNVGNFTGAVSVDILPAGKKSLTSVILPSNLTEIGVSAFLDCPALTGHLIIPESVTKIDVAAFQGCSGITQLTLPSSLLTIEESAFKGCSGLAGSLNIPASVRFIGMFAFYGCSGFKGSLIMHATLQNIEYGAFMYCGFTGELNLPSSLEVINTGVFYGCSGLTSVTIPASVKAISHEAFSGCSHLTFIKALGAQPATINSDYSGEFSPFYNINASTCIIKVPTGSKAAYRAATQWGEFTNIVEE